MKNPPPSSFPAPFNLRRSLTALWLAALALASLPATALAQENLGQLNDIDEIVVVGERVKRDRIELTDSLRFYGNAQATYTSNLADPAQRKGANRFRLAHPDHNALGVTFAKIGLTRPLSGFNEFDAGFRFEIGAGRMVEEVFTDPVLGDQGLTIPQAYVDLQLPTPITPVQLRLGRQYGWFGTESLDLYSNPNVSLSLIAEATPNTVTGASLNLDLGSGFRYTQFLVQGWDVVEDDNDAKTLGGQLAWQTEGLTLAANWILGAERPGASSLLEDDLRWAVELSGRYQATSSTEIRASLLYGQEDFGDDVARFGGASLALTQGLFEVEGAGYHRLTASVRGSFLRDRGGSRTGFDQTLGEMTGTLGIHFSPYASLRAEYRHDFSSRDDAFLGHRGQSSRAGQDTFTLAFEYAF